MVAVMMAGHIGWAVQEGGITVGYADAVILLTLLIGLSLALGFTAEWIYRRPTLKRVSIVAGVVMLALCVPYYWLR